ncbi:MAG: GAF domain-containing protein [Anaerolineales bacterium]|nr:GAF domain-containing protein [Anaerolineales bacterium]
MTDDKTSNSGKTGFQRITAQLIESPFATWFSNLPPVGWLTRRIVGSVVKKKLVEQPAPEVSQSVQNAITGLHATLQSIAYDVVTAHGYLGAMVATYEQGDTLPVRAFYVDPQIATLEQIKQYETAVSKFTRNPVSITNPEIARVYRYDESYSQNLSVKAVESGGPIISEELYDLFCPIAPASSRQTVRGIQEGLGVEQVVAIPFFLEPDTVNGTKPEIVGNMFAAKSGPITQQDLSVLTALSRQAAAAIEAERRSLQGKIAQEIVYALQTNLASEEQILQRIAEGVVADLGYIGAMVGSYEADDSIAVRAFSIAPEIASQEEIQKFEQQISRFSPTPLSLTDPEVARVYRYKDKYKENLSVRAVEAGKPTISDELFDLFRPLTPDVARPMVRAIQDTLGIHKVIAVPFFLETGQDGKRQRKVIGNLFAASRSREFSQGEIELLEGFAQQAAAGIYNARLYRKAEGRRQVAETFGRMAFSATAYLHELRNHIGVFKTYTQVLQRLVGQHEVNPENIDLIKDMLSSTPDISKRLDAAAKILDNLHEPWRDINDEPTDVNKAIQRALDKLFPKLEDIGNLTLQVDLAENLPKIYTSPDMLKEAFTVVIKNAKEAITQKGAEKDKLIWVRSRTQTPDLIEVTITDNGAGIKPEHLRDIFELKWTTKSGGMGFGLYWTKDFIEGIGGEINVDSDYGVGTTFTFLLPVPQIDNI